MLALLTDKVNRFWVLAAIASMTLAISSAVALAGDHGYISGMEDECADIYQGWHDDETGAFDGLDLVRCPGETTGGTPVYYQSYGWSGSTTLYPTSHNGACPGTDIEVYSYSAGAFLGEVHYVQINVAQGVIGSEFGAGPGWTWSYLGTIHSTQPCSYWTGAHLHQSGTRDSSCYPCWEKNTSLPDPITWVWDYWLNAVHW
jgi:hypothetical protein